MSSDKFALLIADVFSEKNCRRVSPKDWNGKKILMSVRSRFLPMFEHVGIETVGDLVHISEAEIMRWPGVKRRSLIFIKEMLADMDLYLGMEVPGQT